MTRHAIKDTAIGVLIAKTEPGEYYQTRCQAMALYIQWGLTKRFQVVEIAEKEEA